MPHIFVLSMFSSYIYKDVLLAISQNSINIEEITYIGYDEGLMLTLSCPTKTQQLQFAAKLVTLGYNVNNSGNSMNVESNSYSYSQTYQGYYQENENE